MAFWQLVTDSVFISNEIQALWTAQGFAEAAFHSHFHSCLAHAVKTRTHIPLPVASFSQRLDNIVGVGVVRTVGYMAVSFSPHVQYPYASVGLSWQQGSSN